MSFWQRWKNKLWIPGVVLGIVFLALGVGMGQLQDMYRKAVMICLECIGIG